MFGKMRRRRKQAQPVEIGGKKRILVHMDRAGGDARGRVLQQGKADRGYPLGHCRGIDRLRMPAA